MPARLLGYISMGKLYVVWVPLEKVIKRVRDLTFDEGTDLEIYGDPDDDYGRFVPPERLENPTLDDHGV
jgi:hypothetical protein